MTQIETSAGPALAAADVPVLRLKRGEDRRLTAGHLWVFSNEVDTAATPLTRFEPGDPVQVHSDRARFLGYGYVNPRSLIAARIVSRSAEQPLDQALLVQRVQVAHSLRRRLFEQPNYRLVYGESDGLPGLVVDRYDQTLVAQIGTAGMERLKPQIAQALEKVMHPRGLLWRNDSSSRELEGLTSYVEPAFGEIPESLAVQENGLSFSVPLGGGHGGGQKTGWFFDQSANRQAFLKYIPGARVLDVFSYVGAWGLAAAKHGATEVTCVDSSQAALEALEANAARNAVKVETIKGDAFEVLERLHEQKQRFDVVVLDPPAFIKRRKDIPKGQAAYRRLNQLGLQLLARDGLLVSCSCSYHLQEAELLAAIQKAARHVGRTVQVLEFGGQAPDHPVHPAIAETRYLKAFFCRAVQD
ncbi:MAG TPA: class I SAM-dependent rRNA methyltransferase [Steroidobacteraceae bacterium]|nr:class I SAM-dependent rRNA methyltransferase [Steroidobacteraceae bacterium]